MTLFLAVQSTNLTGHFEKLHSEQADTREQAHEGPCPVKQNIKMDITRIFGYEQVPLI